MAKLTYFNIIMLCGLLTAYNMQAAEYVTDDTLRAAQGLSGIAQAAQLGQVLADSYSKGLIKGSLDEWRELYPRIRSLEEENLATQAALAAAQTLGGSLSNLKDLASERLSSVAAAAQTKLAPYTQAAQQRLAPVWARVQPYTGYVTGPVNTLASSLARAATATGGAITGGVAGGLERLTTKAGVQEWLNSAAAQQYLQNNFPNVLATLQKVDEQTYQMILGGVALAVGTYLAGKGLAAGYNYLTAGPTLPEPAYFAPLAAETSDNYIRRLIEKEIRLRTTIEELTTKLQESELNNDQKKSLLSKIQQFGRELTSLRNKIDQAVQQAQQAGAANLTLTSVKPGETLTQTIDKLLLAKDQAENEVFKLERAGEFDRAKYAQSIADDLSVQIKKLQSKLPLVQPTAPQRGFFSRMRAKLPTIGMPSMPSLFKRAPEEEEGRAFLTAPSTKPYANLSGLQQLKQARAELNRLQSSDALTPEEKAQIEGTRKAIENEIRKIEAQQPTVEQPTGWGSYLPSTGWLPSFGGRLSTPQEEEAKIEIQRTDFDLSKFTPGKGVKSKAIPVATTQQPTLEQPMGWRSYLRIPSFGGWFSRKPVVE